MAVDNQPSSKPASMLDVAALAGVSRAHVSRYFTGKGYLSDASRERIEAAVEALGYRRNNVARQLRVQRTDTLGPSQLLAVVDVGLAVSDAFLRRRRSAAAATTITY